MRKSANGISLHAYNDFMYRQPRVIVAGSANADLTMITDEFPRPGETIFGCGFRLERASFHAGLCTTAGAQSSFAPLDRFRAAPAESRAGAGG